MSAMTAAPVAAPKRLSTGRIGFLLFLGTEVMLFAGLLSAYVIARGSAGKAWPSPRLQLADGPLMKVPLGATNTVLLISSSILVSIGSSLVRRSNSAGAWKAFAAALVLGSVFLGVKAYEYQEKIHHGLLPATADEHLKYGRHWSSYYFCLTGVHASHIVAGLAVLAWLTVLGFAGRLSSRDSVYCANVATYWHFVDLVWLVLFPVLYLL